MAYRTGIIIKKCLASSKVVVLDRELGVMHYAAKGYLCLGAVIEYQVTRFSGLPCLHAVEQIKLPLALAERNLAFIHYMFELCLYFLPEGSPAPLIFELLEHLYRQEQRALDSFFKKCFLIKFLVLVGVWPSHKKFHTVSIYQLVSGSIDFIVTQGLHLGFDRDVDEWIKSCVLLHPKIAQFKATPFLNESGIS